MRLRQFRLRTFFIVIGVLGAVFAYIALLVRWAAKEEAAIVRLQEAGARIEVSYSEFRYVDFLGCGRLRRTPVGVTFANVGRKFDPRLLEDVKLFRRLAWLDLQRTPIADGALKSVGSMESLRTLYLNDTGVTSVGLGALKSIRHLEEINLSGCRINNASIQELAYHRSLERLLLRGASIDGDLTALSQLTDVRRLDVSECTVHGSERDQPSVGSWICGMKRLEELYLTDWSLRDEDIERLGTLAHLRVLDLSGCTVSTRGLGLLTGIPSLEHLGLSETVIEQSVEALKTLRQLKMLSIQRKPQSISLSSEEFEAIANGTLKTLSVPRPCSGDSIESKVKRSLPWVKVVSGPIEYAGQRGGIGEQVLDLPTLLE